VYFQLTESIKRRLILELRNYWSYHPKYRDDLVDNIQGKYSFRERPQYGIIVKTGSATKVQLSADNYIGIVHSYATLADVQNYPGLSIEWIREDVRAIQNNQGRFPSPPGVYFVELTEDNEFYVDPMLDVRAEQVMQIDATTAKLQNPFIEGTLRLYEGPNGFLLRDGINYTADPATGQITLVEELPLDGHRRLIADYRYSGDSSGPHKLVENRANITAIPGVVLAFGRRNQKGDRQAIVVYGRREASALEYGGKWELSLDFDVMARDVYSQQEIADQSVMYLWGILRSKLSREGIEISDVGMGGESEEIYDETGDDYFYNSNFSITLQTDWFIHVPLAHRLRMISPLDADSASLIAGMSEDDLINAKNNIAMLDSLGLEPVTDPFFRGRANTYEVIR